MATPTPNIDSSRLLKALRDALWRQEVEDGGTLKKRQITRWIEEQEEAGGELWDGEIRPLLYRLKEQMTEDLCTRCGEPAAGGDGWDGLCGNCADRASRKEVG